MGAIVDAVEHVAGALTAAGIRATIDARELNPPGALVVPLEHRYALGMAGGVTVVRVLLVGPNIGTRDSLAKLDEMAETARFAGLLATEQLLVESLTIAGVAAGDPLPAFTFQLDVSHE